ncbi:MAG: polysaccharide biosynthesis C-terminal domain-containing protein, partial [Acidocella sp.]|uniref:hypothetical protein n=1 Tax=Acidocella sp. TaxID=50710 RepID=UPI003FD7990C
LPLVIAGAQMYGLIGVIAARIISETFIALYSMIVIRRLSGLSVTRQLTSCWRSVASVLCMAAILGIATPYFDWGTQTVWVAAQLVANVSLGAAAYTSCLLSLWHIEGRPQGPETFVLRTLTRMRQRVVRPVGIITPSA